MKHVKILSMLLLLLLLSGNAAAKHHGGPGRHGGGGPGFGMMFHPGIMKELNLTKEQKEKIQTFMLKHKEKSIDLRAQMEKNHLALQSVLLEGAVDKAKLNSIKDKMKKSMSAQVDHKFEMIEFLSSVLTKEQKEKMNEIMMERPPKGKRGNKGHKGNFGKGQGPR